MNVIGWCASAELHFDGIPSAFIIFGMATIMRTEKPIMRTIGLNKKLNTLNDSRCCCSGRVSIDVSIVQMEL